MTGTIDEIKEYIETGRTLKMMAEVYSDLAASRLERIRSQIEKNRQFAAQLALAYREVKSATRKIRLKDPVKKDKLNVLLFSNHGYYLSMENQLLDFYKNYQNNSGDLLIIGRSGPEILTNAFTKPYDILIFDHDLPKPAEIGLAAQKIAVYEKINVFFPQLKTVAIHEPTMVDISGEAITQENDPNAVPEGGVAILEPEGAKMMEFFQSQILGLLLEQAFLEAELSRTAERFLTMDSAQQKADTYVKENNINLLRAESSLRGAAILEMSLGVLARKK